MKKKISKLINDFICWIDYKLNDGSCMNCPCYSYERSYFDGDITEYCMCSCDIDFHWYCLAPHFVREWLYKKEMCKEDKYLEELLKDED